MTNGFGKGFIIMGLLVFTPYLLLVYLEHRKETQRAEVAKACDADPKCREAKVNADAKYRSFSASFPVISATGRAFFKGATCRDDCSGHMAGYFWAEARGISKLEGCPVRSASFFEGCTQYATERVTELTGNAADENDDRGSCVPNRYNDC